MFFGAGYLSTKCKADQGASLPYLTFYRRVMCLKCSNQILWNLKEARNVVGMSQKEPIKVGRRGYSKRIRISGFSYRCYL